MGINKTILITFLFIWMFVFNFSLVLGQETIPAQVVKQYPNGCYLVQIGGQTYLAITESIEKEMLKVKRDVLDAQKEILLKDSLMANYDRTIAWYDTTINNMRAYIKELEEVLNGYKSLLRDYKRLKKPWVTLDGGVGITGDDSKPAVSMGMGIRQLRIYFFFQEKNAGILVGKQFRVF